MDAKILVVEDDFLTQENIESTLRTEGYSIEKAFSPSEAMEKVSANRPDLIIMDIDLKADMDGVELAVQIRNKYPGIPVIYLTDKRDERIVQRSRIVHHALYMTKPFEYAVLLSNVNLIVNQAPKEKCGPRALYVKNKANSSAKSGISYDSIYYLQAQRSYCNLHYLPDGAEELNKEELSISMSAVLDKLPRSEFIQVHRSYCININKVDAIDLPDLVVHGVSVPIGKSFREKVLESLNQV